MLLDTQPYKVPAVEQPLEPWRQLLLDAADRIERVGWWDGTRRTTKHHSAFCVLTALFTSSKSKPRIITEVQAARKFSDFVGGISIPDWNDAPGRTKEEVLAAMRGAANAV